MDRTQITAAKNDIQFAAEVVVSIIVLCVLVRQHFPDLGRTTTMRACRITARTANRQADMWSRIASNANTRYIRCTNVTV